MAPIAAAEKSRGYRHRLDERRVDESFVTPAYCDKKGAPTCRDGIPSGRSPSKEELIMRTMRIVACAIIVTTGVVGLIGSALAADMTAAEIKAFLSGKTVYLEATTASASGQAGQGVIYWAEDGTALYKTPSGTMFHGKWELKGNSNCADWKERPGMGCVRYDKTGDVVTVIDVASGQARAKIMKTAPGNAEKLAP
jgi:hypothetical protein